MRTIRSSSAIGGLSGTFVKHSTVPHWSCAGVSRKPGFRNLRQERIIFRHFDGNATGQRAIGADGKKLVSPLYNLFRICYTILNNERR